MSSRRHSSSLAPRWELVQRVRRDLARGCYETPDQWEVVLERLLEDLNS